MERKQQEWLKKKGLQSSWKNRVASESSEVESQARSRLNVCSGARDVSFSSIPE